MCYVFKRLFNGSFLCFALIFNFQFSIFNYLSAQVNWEELRAAEAGKSPFISRIVEYKPAPGQFINQENLGTPKAARSIIGGLNGIVSLGGFGGYITLGFDRKILNDPSNPYGVDFVVVGNATSNHSEPGIVMAMADTNGNGIPDDGEWYELKGSNHDLPTTKKNYTITYKNLNSEKAADVEWTDSEGNKGALKAVLDNKQPYYPLPDIFPDYPQEEVSFTGTLIEMDIDDRNPSYILISSLPFGYADNLPFTGSRPPFYPDNPHTVDVIEGNGGDAFDISWAVDKEGNPVVLESIDFIRIYTAVNANVGWLGEISTEVRGVIIMTPDNVLSVPEWWSSVPDISVYPNPAAEYVHIQIGDKSPIKRIEIWNTAGQLFYANATVNADLLTVPVYGYPAGTYIVCAYGETRRTVKKIVIH